MHQQQHDSKKHNSKTTTANTQATTSSSALPNAIVQDAEQQHWPALHEAAAAGNEALLSNLLSGGILRTAKEPKQGNTALHEAAFRGYSRCVKLLCTPPATNNNESGGKKFSCVLRKRKKQTPDSQRAAAVHSILLGLQNHAGFTALHLAAQQGHNQSCRELLLAGADADVQNKYGDTALHTACRYGHAGASRILLSANCDANKVNLNGDTALHISCAMRRRKLTRILLTEGECDMSIKNAQNETPIDIVIRKSYVEIFDILNSQQRLRQQRKQRHKTDKKDKPTQDVTDTINWSPYGCHYFPDPRAFPAPKLETLPKEPLAQGEQYYSDLNGCIRKGPIGVGSTCYCAPFFRHIEHKINCNRRSLRRYVHNAKATLGNEVKALAERTTQQIEQLTRDMLCDRVRCESRRRHIDYWLQMAAATQTKDKTPNKSKVAEDIEHDRALTPVRYSLSRCQSLDALSEHKTVYMEFNKLHSNNAQSCQLLDENNRDEMAAATDLDSLDKQSNLEQISDDDQQTQTSITKSEQREIDLAAKNKKTEKEEEKEEAHVEYADFTDHADRVDQDDLSLYNGYENGVFGRVRRRTNNQLTVKAVIEHEEVQDQEEEADTATLTPFVVPKEKMDISPSYAQLKKCNGVQSDDIEKLADNLDHLELTPEPILHKICMEADNMEALSDTPTEESEEDDPDELVDDPQQISQREHAMDYLYALRKRLQSTTTTGLVESNKILQQQLEQHQQQFSNNNGLIHNHHFVNNHVQERVVPKNAYFHALPTKIQNHNNNNNQILQQHAQNQMINVSIQQQRAQSALGYANLPQSPSPSLRQDPRLAQRLGLPTANNATNNLYLPMSNGHVNGNYLSPVNSNSGSSIASSTPDYERALRHAVISRQTYLPQQSQHVRTNQSNIYRNNNSNNFMLQQLEPASTQLIYSANTVALALADETNEVAENEANSAYPLVSSLV